MAFAIASAPRKIPKGLSDMRSPFAGRRGATRFKVAESRMCGMTARNSVIELGLLRFAELLRLLRFRRCYVFASATFSPVLLFRRCCAFSLPFNEPGGRWNSREPMAADVSDRRKPRKGR